MAKDSLSEILNSEPPSPHLSEDEFISAIYFHQKDCHKGTDYERIFTHMGACKTCNRLVKQERERNPLYQGYIEAAEKDKVQEYWDEIRRLQIEISEEFKHKD